MRNSFNFYPALYKIIAVIVCFLLVLLYNKSRADDGSPKKMQVKFLQLTNHSVSVEINSATGKNTELFLFSAEGKLEKNICVAHAKTTIIQNLAKGTYLYQCFDNDKELHSGKMFLK